VPVGWFAPTWSVAPIESAWFPPPFSAPVAFGVLVNVFTVMLFPPLVIVVDAGSVMLYVAPPKPETRKAPALELVALPSEVPPDAVRAPAGVITTAPAEPPGTTLPKLRSDVFAIEIPVTMVAVALQEDVAVFDWAPADPLRTTAKRTVRAALRRNFMLSPSSEDDHYGDSGPSDDAIGHPRR
jgi:hypothetical protein